MKEDRKAGSEVFVYGVLELGLAPTVLKVGAGKRARPDWGEP